MGFANRAIVVGWLGLGAAALVGCGGGGALLSTDQANSLKGQLDAVSADVANGRCVAAQGTIAHIRTALGNYSALNQTLVLNLDQGVSEVGRLAAAQCEASAQVPAPPSTPPHRQVTTTPVITTPATTSQSTSTTTTPATTSTTTTTQTVTNGGVGIGGGTIGGTGTTPGNTTTGTTSTSTSTSTSTTGTGGVGSGGAGTGN
jgi:hypothetical protein